MSGKVYLVGAGPGDVELLTLKAIRALARADVVLIDDLVNREVLQFVPPWARVITVGKRKGCRVTPQAFIDQQMVRYAREGLCVVRLKGGDPYVFGRGGEEAEILRRAGVECEIVCGITAGIGVPAALGIPVTHRDYAHGVTFVTGHSSAGAEPPWDALARTDTTLVVYMGLSRVREIAERLMAAGMMPQTPVAAIQHGTLANQRQVVSTLHAVADAVRGAGLESPCLLVIGKVVDLATVPAHEAPWQRVLQAAEA